MNLDRTKNQFQKVLFKKRDKNIILVARQELSLRTRTIISKKVYNRKIKHKGFT